MLRLAIIADDLTGALDSSAPFAARGLQTVVVTDAAALDTDACRGAEVLCICTSTREMPPSQAAEKVTEAARWLAPMCPGAIFKKVDSRLKGHVAAEALAVAAVFRRKEVVVAPAIPSQGRIVERGQLRGHGVARSIRVAEHFPGIVVNIPDTPDQAALERLVSDDTRWPARLFVGASGLAAALAARMSPAAPRNPAMPAGKLLIAIGSRDPITLAQVAQARDLPGIDFIATTDGHLPATGGAAVTICQAIPPDDETFPQVMTTFGQATAHRIRQTLPDCILVSGGETAQTVLSSLGVTLLSVAGDVLPGIAMSWLNVGDRRLALITKSGSFGRTDDLGQITGAFLGASGPARGLCVGDTI